MHDYQFGFRKKRSTQFALLAYLDFITEALENNEYAISLFIDFSKAFDTLNHAILIRKLEHYGVRGIALDYIQNYLTNRTQCVDLEGSLSSHMQITCGVPQGSILGPLLFIIYVNDIFSCSKILRLFLFADDTTIVNRGKNLTHLIHQTNSELILIKDWLNANKLTVNIKKLIIYYSKVIKLMRIILIFSLTT